MIVEFGYSVWVDITKILKGKIYWTEDGEVLLSVRLGQTKKVMGEGGLLKQKKFHFTV